MFFHMFPRCEMPRVASNLKELMEGSAKLCQAVDWSRGKSTGNHGFSDEILFVEDVIIHHGIASSSVLWNMYVCMYIYIYSRCLILI